MNFWEPAHNTGIPSWRRDLLLEEEPEEVLNWAPPIPPLYDFGILSYIQHFEIETPRMNELFLEKRQILKSSLEDSEEGFLWSHGGIVRTTRNAIKRSRKERERQDWEDERNYLKYRTDERDSRHGERGHSKDHQYEERRQSKDHRHEELRQSKDRHREEQRLSKDLHREERRQSKDRQREERRESKDRQREERRQSKDHRSGEKSSLKDHRYGDYGQDKERFERDNPHRKGSHKSRSKSSESEYGEDGGRCDMKYRVKDDGNGRRRGSMMRGEESERKRKDREDSPESLNTEKTQDKQSSGDLKTSAYQEWKARNAAKKAAAAATK